MAKLAFTTRIPLAVMFVMGKKQWENRTAMPSPTKGCCAMTCSKSSDAREYSNFLTWAEHMFKPEAFVALPSWEQVSVWRGKVVAVCAYDVSYTAPNPPFWDGGYPVWWHFSNMRLDRLFPTPWQCRDVAVAGGCGDSA